MKSMLVISSSYLKPCYKESIKYSFKFIGYTTFKKALESMYKINLMDVIGVCYLDDALPTRDEEKESMKKFLKLLDISEFKGKFIFMLSEDNKADLEFCTQLSNLKIGINSFHDNLTDIVINTNIYGSLLLEMGKPYKWKKDIKVEEEKWETPRLDYTSIVDKRLLLVLGKVNKLSSVEETLLYDNAFSYFDSCQDNLSKFMREIKITKDMGYGVDIKLKKLESIAKEDPILNLVIGILKGE